VLYILRITFRDSAHILGFVRDLFHWISLVAPLFYSFHWDFGLAGILILRDFGSLDICINSIVFQSKFGFTGKESFFLFSVHYKKFDFNFCFTGIWVLLDGFTVILASLT
jgi:hypothetical protein